MKKGFLLLTIVILGLGSLFWLRKFYHSSLPAIPQQIIVGTSADYPPLTFKRNDNLVGFDIDVITEACKRLGTPLIIKDMPFELLMPQVQLGTIHVIAAGISPTKERMKRAFFTPTYLNSGSLSVLSLKEKPIENLSDLERNKIAVNKGYIADQFMTKIDTIDVKRYPSITDAIQALQSGKVNAFATATNTIPAIFENYDSENFSLFLIQDTDENTALAISKLYPELKNKLSDIIEKMKEDGTIMKIKDKWNIQ